jgi:hypothetical protein
MARGWAASFMRIAMHDHARSIFERPLRTLSAGRAAATVALSLALLSGVPGLRDSLAAAGPFDDFTGSWTGTGTIQLGDGRKERIRCQATYQPRGRPGIDINARLACASDSYKFELAGELQANANNISGRWSELTRNIGGSITGAANGNRLQVLAESSVFSATLFLVTRNRQQTVSIKAWGGGEKVEASIALRRGN